MTIADLPRPEAVPVLFEKHGIIPMRGTIAGEYKWKPKPCGCLIRALAEEFEPSIEPSVSYRAVANRIGLKQMNAMIAGFDGCRSPDEYGDFYSYYGDFYFYGAACAEAVFG